MKTQTQNTDEYKTFSCELKIKNKDSLITELEHIIKQIKWGYTSGRDWNTNLNII